jgi:fumarylpyruvate hydrolase
VSAICPAAEVGHPGQGAIWLEVNGETRQRANLSEMIWNIAEIVAELSTYYELRPGDLVFTGTPEGVGPVRRGDSLVGGIDGLETLRITIV